MGMEEIIDVQITLETRTVSQKGFGTLMLLAYHTKWTDLYRRYTADELLDTLLDEGFETWSATYRMAEAILRQNPHVTDVMVGRVTAAPSEGAKYAITIDPAVSEGDVVSVDSQFGAVPGTISYTLTAGQDAEDAATAYAALLNAIPDIGTAIPLANVVTFDLVDPVMLMPFFDSENCTVQNVSVDQGYPAALNAISNAPSGDDYYGVAVANNSPANLDAVAEWVETKPKLFFGHFMGTVAQYTAWCTTHATDALHRTLVTYQEPEKDLLYMGVEQLALFLSAEPGAMVLAFKEMPGISVSDLSSSDRAAIKAVKGNTYRNVGGVNIIQDGQALSGRYIDLTISLDWLVARTRERAFRFVVSKPRLPYTDKSVSQVVGEVQAVLDIASIPMDKGGREILRDNPRALAKGPKVADVAIEDRQNRLLPDITFTGEMAGAIQGAKIRGTLSL